MNKFQYIIDKINESKFIEKPFKHLEITNFLSSEHLNIILNNNQIHFDNVKNTNELIRTLNLKKYKIQPFPGCTTNINEYLKSLKNNNFNTALDILEGCGVTYRLNEYDNNLIKELMNFMNSKKFQNVLEKKFNITKNTKIISAIQKNLTKYEISPHPDVRGKALTYLININKNKETETQNIHTHLLQFKPEYQYIKEYWSKNTNIQRCWVPWHWCETIKYISKNNSMVIFKPNNDTLHAVKLDYDHTKLQRTQIYGNLMFIKKEKYEESNYKSLL